MNAELSERYWRHKCIDDFIMSVRLYIPFVIAPSGPKKVVSVHGGDEDQGQSHIIYLLPPRYTYNGWKEL